MPVCGPFGSAGPRPSARIGSGRLLLLQSGSRDDDDHVRLTSTRSPDGGGLRGRQANLRLPRRPAICGARRPIVDRPLRHW